MPEVPARVGCLRMLAALDCPSRAQHTGCAVKESDIEIREPRPFISWSDRG
jgi:hypothetical protein